MVHARVLDNTHFVVIFTSHHICTVLPIKHLINQEGEPITLHKLANGTKYSVSNIRVLVCPCVVKKRLHTLTERRQTCVINHKRVFAIYLLEFHNTKKGTSSTYLVHKNIFRHMTVYLTKTILVPWHTCHVHIQSHLRRDQRSCTFHIIHHLKNIITFSQFEEGDLLEKERNLVK